MKRSSSEIPSSPISSASDADIKPDVPPTPSDSKRSRPTSKTSTPNKKSKKEADVAVSGGGSGGGNGEWDSEKKAVMMDTIIAAGYKATDLDALADKVSRRLILSI
jgi:hypothetical protein